MFFTGSLRISVDDGCRLLVDSICTYMKTNPRTSLKMIYLVDTNAERVDQFRVLLTKQVSALEIAQNVSIPNNRYSNLDELSDLPESESKSKDDVSTLVTQKPVDNHQVASKTKNDTSTVDTLRLVQNNKPARFEISDSCTVEVEKADFRSFQADALIVTLGANFTRASDQVLALTMTAGEKYYEELKQKESAKPGDVVVTGAGNMGFDHVIHGLWGTSHSSDIEELRKLVPRILNKADELDVKTLAVPPLWKGKFGIAIITCFVIKCYRFLTEAFR